MSVLHANCPSCAGPLEFKAGSTIVMVCPFCRSAVARTDRGLNDLGKVAEIVESQSPLKLGLKGMFRGERFELTGRAQMGHEMGGFWDEWYATFSNGWVGWLAEAQGRFYLTFHQPNHAPLPPFEQLQLRQPVQPTLMVTEKGTATARAADGEIPYPLVPNEQSRYADLSGPNNAFGTIDYSTNPPTLFVGSQVSLADIGLADAKPAERAARTVSAAAMGCPNCGGPLNLTAPDQSERVTCPNCDSLLDVNQGNLRFLHVLNKNPSDQFVLPIGQKGVFPNGDELTLIGAMARSVTIEGIIYFWHEYLLYNPSIGFRWLVQSDNHWNYVEPVNTADVVIVGNTAVYNKNTFKIFQDAPARVEYVKGEFYWRVEQGEIVRAIDYVAPPLMLSCEVTANEMNWSQGTYMAVADVEKAFSVTDLPRPANVAPNQPFTGGYYIKAGLIMLALLFVISIVKAPLSGGDATVLNQTITFPPAASQNAPQTVFSDPFELKPNKALSITANAPVDNSWVNVDIDLVNDQNNDVDSLEIPIEYYSGVEDGESWSEGSKYSSNSLSAVPGGKYTLRAEATWQNFAQPMPVSLRIVQSAPSGDNFCFVFVMLAIIPCWNLLRKFMFESKRWSESMFHGSTTSSSE
jgi:Zn finger protein HypA/HybF involved in hydrogenase expression